MESVLGKMEAEYEKLTTFLSEATVNPKGFPVLRLHVGCLFNESSNIKVCSVHHPELNDNYRPSVHTTLRKEKTQIQEHFVMCTKLDVSMNSLLLRGKNFGFIRRLTFCTAGKNTLKLKKLSHMEHSTILPYFGFQQLEPVGVLQDHPQTHTPSKEYEVGFQCGLQCSEPFRGWRKA